jgi:hypothetical protein
MKDANALSGPASGSPRIRVAAKRPSDAGQRAVRRAKANLGELEAALSILIEAEGNFRIGRKARGIVCVECATVMLRRGIDRLRREDLRAANESSSPTP